MEKDLKREHRPDFKNIVILDSEPREPNDSKRAHHSHQCY